MHRYRNPRVELRDGQEDSLCHYSSWTACFLSPASWFCWSEILPTCSPSLPLHPQDIVSLSLKQKLTPPLGCVWLFCTIRKADETEGVSVGGPVILTLSTREREFYSCGHPSLSIYFSLPPLYQNPNFHQSSTYSPYDSCDFRDKNPIPSHREGSWLVYSNTVIPFASQ